MEVCGRPSRCRPSRRKRRSLRPLPVRRSGTPYAGGANRMVTSAHGSVPGRTDPFLRTAPHRQRCAAPPVRLAVMDRRYPQSSTDRSGSAVRASVLAVCAEMDRSKRRRSGSVHRHGRAGWHWVSVRPLWCARSAPVPDRLRPFYRRPPGHARTLTELHCVGRPRYLRGGPKGQASPRCVPRAATN